MKNLSSWIRRWTNKIHNVIAWTLSIHRNLELGCINFTYILYWILGGYKYEIVGVSNVTSLYLQRLLVPIDRALQVFYEVFLAWIPHLCLQIISNNNRLSHVPIVPLILRRFYMWFFFKFEEFAIPHRQIMSICALSFSSASVYPDSS